MEKTCPACGKTYVKIGKHWDFKPEHRPSLTEEQKEIITGVLMSDGYMSKNGKNPRLEVNNTNKKYLKYLDSKFEVLGSGVELKRTPEESAQEHKKRNFARNPLAENYKTLYHWRTCTHKDFSKWRNWYNSGKKSWPKDIDLTPTVLKHLYVGDGHYDTAQHHDRIKIAMANEIENREKINSLFEDKGLPSPSNYNISKRKDGGKTCVAVFSKKDSKRLFKYMGDAPPGFEYKWP